MLNVLRKRRDDEEGFTLIELMVVVLIIAILLAIAIPTFLGARNRANDRAAQSSLRNALTAAKVIFTDKQDYTQATLAALTAEEPSLTFQSTASASPKEVMVGTSTVTTWTAVAKSKAGKCFYINDNSAAGGNGTTFGVKTLASGATTCDMTAPPAYTQNGWD